MSTSPSDIILLDSDAFALLAVSDLIHHLPTVYNTKLNAFRRLGAIQAQMQRQSFQNYSAPDCKKVFSWTKKIASVDAEPRSPSLEAFLEDEDSIDEGEAVLFSLLIDNPGWRMVTGDLKALTALATSVHLESSRAKLKGRIACVESIIAELRKKIGYENVMKALVPHAAKRAVIESLFPHGDKTVQVICESAELEVLQTIQGPMNVGFLQFL